MQGMPASKPVNSSATCSLRRSWQAGNAERESDAERVDAERQDEADELDRVAAQAGERTRTSLGDRRHAALRGR